MSSAVLDPRPVLAIGRSAQPPTASGKTCSCGAPVVANGECAKCNAKRAVLQRRAAGPRSPEAVSPVPGDVLASPGLPLGEAMRSEMEPRFGYDFSHVRVHTDDAAARSARAVDALAYTVGRHVVFDSGNFRPTTQGGRQLLAHELTHVIQQGGRTGLTPDGPDAEREADLAGTRAAAGHSVDVRRAVAPTIQRQPKTRGAPPRAAPPRPTLGSCRPVQDDLKPTKPWDVLQKEYQASCGSTLSRVWGDLRRGEMPSLSPGNAKGGIDCACAEGPPNVAAQAAKVRLVMAGRLALGLYNHFLDGSGKEMTIDVNDMLTRSDGARHKIRAAMASGALTGHTRLEQDDYKVDEFQFAYGAIDCVHWQVMLPPGTRKPTDATPVKVSMLDYYEFHPGRPGVSQCAHAAAVELVAEGKAKNFWTRGEATVTWGFLNR